MTRLVGRGLPLTSCRRWIRAKKWSDIGQWVNGMCPFRRLGIDGGCTAPCCHPHLLYFYIPFDPSLLLSQHLAVQFLPHTDLHLIEPWTVGHG